MLRLADLGRLVHIVGVLLRFLIVTFHDRVARRIAWLRFGRATLSGPDRLRHLLEELGGSFIKFGQILSLQPDLIPRPYCDALFDLLDRVPPFAFDDVEEIFRQDLDSPPDGIFDTFDPQPFASASIGQVHRATLGGNRLAVKVRRPTAVGDFGGDIRLMRLALRLMAVLRLRGVEAFRMPIEEFIAWTTDELDYRTEARYMSEVGRNSSHRPESNVPAVYSDLSTHRILVTDFIAGPTLLEYLRSLDRRDPAVAYRLKETGFDPEKFADNIISNFLGDVFRHGVFHADLHPANLLILPDNVVGYVDFGITGVISEYGRQHVLALILALSRRDLDGLYEGLLRISNVEASSDRERFRRGLDRLADDWFEQKKGVARLRRSYTVIMLDMIRLSRECNLLPHEEALRYMRSVVTADGLIARFAPGYDTSAALEESSRRELESQAWKSTFSADAIVDVLLAGSRLIHDGTTRLDRLLDRLERSQRRSSKVEKGVPPRLSRRYEARLARLTFVLMGLSALIALGGEPTHMGFNLLTAQLALFAAGILSLLITALRWLVT